MPLFRAYARAYAGLPRAVWLLSLVIFVNRCGTMVLPFLALYLSREQDYSAAEAGRMLAVYGVGGIVGAQIGGSLTQRFGGVVVAFVSLTLATPGFWLIPWCESFEAICAALLYLSIVFEPMRPAIGAATIEFCPADRHARAFALNRLAMNLGMSIGPVVGGVLATINYTLLFVVNGVFVSLSAVVIALSFGLHRRAGRREARAPVSSGRSPWRDWSFLAFLGLKLGSALVFFQVIGALPLYWAEYGGLSEARIGLLFVGNTLLIVACEMLLTDRLSHYAPLRVVAWGTVFLCVGFGATPFGAELGLAPGNAAFVFACVLVPMWTMGEMLISPFSLTYLARASEGGQRGEYVGLFSTMYAVAFVFAPIIGTWLYEIDPRLPWWCCLASAAPLAVGFLLLNARLSRAAAVVVEQHEPAELAS